MQQSWMVHWRFQYWSDGYGLEYRPLQRAGSNQFRRRGLQRGDQVYVVSLAGGRLYLGGRMRVDDIVSRLQAVRLFDEPDLIDKREWIVGSEAHGTPINFHRRLSPELARRLRFIATNGPARGLCFVNRTALDGQTTRTPRRLTAESARLLDELLQSSDRMRRTRRLITLTDAHIAKRTARATQR